MRCRANSGSEGEDVPKFICCVDGRQPQIHEVRTFGEDGVTCEVNPTLCVYVTPVSVDEFFTNDLTLNWRRVPIFGRNSINGSAKWIGVPDFLRNDGQPWTLNILAFM